MLNRRMARCAILALVVLSGGTPVLGQQSNSPQATMLFAGVDGPQWPIQLPINSAIWGTTLTLDVTGAPNQPYTIYTAPAGTTSPGTPTGFGFVDLDMSQGLVPVISGILSPTGRFNTSFVLPFPTPVTGDAQAFVHRFAGWSGCDSLP